MRIFLFFALLLGAPFQVWAQTLPASFPLPPALQAVVRLQCDNRQGSGTVINGDKGYVLSAAHVATDIHTNRPAERCTVDFIDLQNGKPRYTYEASVVRFVFFEARNQDFAILQIGKQVSVEGLSRPFPFVRTNEFASVGEPIGLYGFSQGGNGLIRRSGVIEKFEHGFIKTNAEVSPGDSGGAALNQHFQLIGVPNRIVTITSQNDEVSVAYELVDIRAVLTWLDTFGSKEHDQYFVHEDYSRYHQSAVYIQSTDLDCDYVARTVLASTVYCLRPEGDRLVFPNDATYLSWFADFTNVITVSPETIREYNLARNVTLKPGTLVKSATAPNVYVIIDSFGSMRWIPSEEKARALWGQNWASQVRDIPDEFWINYTIGQPLEN